MSDQLVKCLKCEETKHKEREQKLDKILEYMQEEIEMKEFAIEQKRETELHQRREESVSNLYIYAAMGIGFALLVCSSEFKTFMNKTTTKVIIE